MTTLKKFLALLLAIMMLFSAATLLAGCDDSGSKKKSSSSKKDDDEDEDEDEDNEDEDEDKDDEDEDKDDEDEDKDNEDEDKEDKDDKDNKDDKNDKEEKPGKQEVSSNNAALVGTWSYEKNIAELLNDIYAQQYGDSFVAPKGNMYLYIEMKFEKDGDYTMSVNLDEDSATDYLEELCVSVADCIYAMLAEQGLDKDAVDAQLGMSAEEYYKQMFTYETIAESYNQENSGYYYEEDGKIYIAESEDDQDDPKSYMIYKLSGKKLTISDIYNFKNDEFATESEEMQSNPVMQFPMVLEKQ